MREKNDSKEVMVRHWDRGMLFTAAVLLLHGRKCRSNRRNAKHWSRHGFPHKDERGKRGCVVCVGKRGWGLGEDRQTNSHNVGKWHLYKIILRGPIEQGITLAFYIKYNIK